MPRGHLPFLLRTSKRSGRPRRATDAESRPPAGSPGVATCRSRALAQPLFPAEGHLEADAVARRYSISSGLGHVKSMLQPMSIMRRYLLAFWAGLASAELIPMDTTIVLPTGAPGGVYVARCPTNYAVQAIMTEGYNGTVVDQTLPKGKGAGALIRCRSLECGQSAATEGCFPFGPTFLRAPTPETTNGTCRGPNDNVGLVTGIQFRIPEPTDPYLTDFELFCGGGAPCSRASAWSAPETARGRTCHPPVERCFS